MVDEVQETLVRPVEVLEDEHGRAGVGQRLEETTPRRERLGPAVVRALLAAQPEQRPDVGEHPFGLVRLGQERLDGVRELGVRDLGRVVLEDARLRLRHLAERPEADALAVWQGAALAPRDQLGQRLDDREQLGDEPALADPRNAHERHELRLPLAPHAVQCAPEERDLVLPSDQACEHAALDVDADSRLCFERLPGRHGLRLPLRVTATGGP